MAFSTTTVQPNAQLTPAQKPAATDSLALLSAVLLTVYAGKQSRKQLRKLKRKAAWLLVKQKAATLFSRKAASERQIIIYVLIGVLIIALVIIEPIVALVLAIIGLILFLTGTI